MRPCTSDFVPEPSTIVVSSLVTTTLRARPSSSRPMLSSFRPTSSETTWPPVRIAMSWSIALRRSPKPGALMATDLNVPRILLTTSVASASPSTSSAMMTKLRPPCMTFSSTGSMSLTAEILFEAGLHALGVGDEVRRDVALVEAHTLDEVELHPEGLALLDGDHAVLADLLERLGDHPADVRVGGRDRRDVGDLLLVRLDLDGAVLDLSDCRVDGRLDALLQAHRVGAGGHVAQALAHHRPRQNRGGRGAVTGDVVGILGDVLDELGA